MLSFHSQPFPFQLILSYSGCPSTSAPGTSMTSKLKYLTNMVRSCATFCTQTDELLWALSGWIGNDDMREGSLQKLMASEGYSRVLLISRLPVKHSAILLNVNSNILAVVMNPTELQKLHRCTVDVDTCNNVNHFSTYHESVSTISPSFHWSSKLSLVLSGMSTEESFPKTMLALVAKATNNPLYHLVLLRNMRWVMQV